MILYNEIRGDDMTTLTLFYATNRNHKGNRWNPKSYDSKFSSDGMENLRFGVVKVEASGNDKTQCLNFN